MKKIVLALACSVMAASAPLAPASAQSCGKIDWLYAVDGEYLTGWEIVYYVDLLTGGDYSLQGAVQWLSQHGSRIRVIIRGCSIG